MKIQKRKLIAAVSLCAAIAIPTPSSAASISGQGTWESTLQGRDLDGNLSTFEAYYDTSLNITWLADANYAGTTMNWTTANAWAASLNPYGSNISGWRLTSVTDAGGPGCNFAYTGTDCGYNVNTATGEMAHMFYTTLGNLAYFSTSGVGNQPGYGFSNTGPFSNAQSDAYWTATTHLVPTSYSEVCDPFLPWWCYATNTYDNAWNFGTTNGSQNISVKTGSFYAWAVHSGDVGASTVPVPAAVWLFSSGLLGLVGMSGKRRR